MRSYKSIIVAVCLTQFFVGNSQILDEYGMYANHFDIEAYTKQYDRDFDSIGIITQKKEYHALTIAVYGIMSADEFIKTGDSIFYRKALNQYKYFTDTSKLMFFDEGESVGLPYRFNFNGLKAPWFSGMTQGMAASFLLRYYRLTGDESALDLSKKIIRYMLKDEKDGGTIGRTAEGYMWIEEYPNCASSKCVLNGFINGLIGLYEYSLFFPEDTLAESVHASCYEAMFSTLEAYDLPNWTTYNRNKKSIRNSYIRYQMQEFDHMYHLYEDDRFRQQMRIWAKFAFGKIDKELKFYKTPGYEFGVRLKSVQGEWIYTNEEGFRKSLRDVKDIEFKKRKKVNKYDLRYGDGVNYCEFSSTELRSKAISVKTFAKGIELSPEYMYRGDTVVVQSSVPFDRIELNYKKKVKVKVNNLKSSVYNYQKQELPMFAFIEMKNKPKLDKDKIYKVVLNGNNITNAQIYYRVAEDINKLSASKYSIEKSFKYIDANTFTPQQNGYYEFFVSYDITMPISKISRFSIEAIK